MTFRAAHPWTWVAEREQGKRRNARSLGNEDTLHKELYGAIRNVGCWDPEFEKDQFQHGAVFNFDFAKDGTLLVAACERKSLLLFDPLNHQHIQSVHNSHADCVNCVRFLDTRVFATCSDDTNVALWDVRYLKTKMRTLQGHSNWVKNIEYAQDKGLLVTSGFDGSIYAWNINSYSENESTVFQRIFHMSGLMRMKLTPDADKLIVATAGGYLMVIHDLDLPSVGNDLHGFKPNMYRLMQMSHSPIRQGYTFNHLFHERRRRNRVEFISDFPEGNDAEVIASLQIHPNGEFSLSRNTSSDENSEWTCVHEITSKARPDLQGDADSCLNCGKPYSSRQDETQDLDSHNDVDEMEGFAFSQTIRRSSEVDEETIVPLASPSRETSMTQNLSGGPSLASSLASSLSEDTISSSANDFRDRSPIVQREANTSSDAMDFVSDDSDSVNMITVTASASFERYNETFENQIPNQTSPLIQVSQVLSTPRQCSVPTSLQVSMNERQTSLNEENQNSAQLYVSSSSLMSLSTNANSNNRGGSRHVRPSVRIVTHRSGTGAPRRPARPPPRVIVRRVNGQRVTVIRRGRTSQYNERQESRSQLQTTSLIPTADERNNHSLPTAPRVNPLEHPPARTFQIRSGTQPPARTVLLLNRDMEVDVDSIGAAEEVTSFVVRPSGSQSERLESRGDHCTCQDFMQQDHAPSKTIHDNSPRLSYFEEESNIGKGFIKELCFSSDGRLICSPFGYGVRLLGFNQFCSDLGSLPRHSEPKRLHTVATLASHTNTVVCTKWSPTHCLFVSACLNGKVVFCNPVL